jgi:hypothetical protein
MEHWMKKMISPGVLAGALLIISGCVGNPKTVSALRPVPEYVEKTEAWEVLDHKTKATGQDVPEWVTRFISDGLPGVEEMSDYQDKYVFIGEDTGTNLNALRQWTTGFTVAQDFSRLVSIRVQARLTGAAAGSPDDVFGRYFENLVRTTSDTVYSGARKESDFWLFKRYFQADGTTVDREVFDFYILVTIDKELLQGQINDILNRVQMDVASTKGQTSAIDRIKQTFYEGF